MNEYDIIDSVDKIDYSYDNALAELVNMTYNILWSVELATPK